MNNEVEELRKRVRLTPDEIRGTRKRQEYLDPYWSADRENAMIEAGAEAQLNKVLNDDALALIDRERKIEEACDCCQFNKWDDEGQCEVDCNWHDNCWHWSPIENPKAGDYFPAIPLAEALKEVTNETNK